MSERGKLTRAEHWSATCKRQSATCVAVSQFSTPVAFSVTHLDVVVAGVPRSDEGDEKSEGRELEEHGE